MDQPQRHLPTATGSPVSGAVVRRELVTRGSFTGVAPYGRTVTVTVRCCPAAEMARARALVPGDQRPWWRRLAGRSGGDETWSVSVVPLDGPCSQPPTVEVLVHDRDAAIATAANLAAPWSPRPAA